MKTAVVLLALIALCIGIVKGQDEAVEDSCGTGHPKIGATAELENFFHEISGTVVVLDNCTFEVKNFTYDGTGPDVFWYGADTRANLAAGFIMMELPSSHGPWDGTEEMIVKIPTDMGVTWDDINVLSVWCREFGIDFGSVVFGNATEGDAPPASTGYEEGDAEKMMKDEEGMEEKPEEDEGDGEDEMMADNDENMPEGETAMDGGENAMDSANGMSGDMMDSGNRRLL